MRLASMRAFGNKLQAVDDNIYEKRVADRLISET